MRNKAVAIGGAMILALLVAAPASVGARELGADELLDRLQAWLDGTRDLTANFRQTMESGALGSDLEESGRVFVVRPGRMRWDYLEPEYKVALVEGLLTRLYVAEDAQLWEGQLEESGAALPLLLSGQRPLRDLFDASAPAETVPASAGGLGLVLAPKGDDEGFEEVRLELDPTDFGIEAAEVLDAAGNTMRYRFTNLERNRGVPATTFHFEPPPGTEVVSAP